MQLYAVIRWVRYLFAYGLDTKDDTPTLLFSEKRFIYNVYL